MQTIQIRLLIIFILSSITLSFNAQVTVGLGENPMNGALLQLKSVKDSDSRGKANASQGLMLPRVRLSKKDHLYPMFYDGLGGSTADYTGANKAIQDAMHTGLVVYNLNRCNGFGQGVYVWGNNLWRALPDVTPGSMILDKNIEATTRAIVESATGTGNEVVVLETTWLNSQELMVHIPSGSDLRKFPADQKFKIKINWTSEIDPLIKDDVIESQPGLPALSWVSNSATTWGTPMVLKPTEIEFSLKDMADIVPDDENAYSTNPFRNRETIVKLKVAEDECGPAKVFDLILNQTNYQATFKKENNMLHEYGYLFKKGDLYARGAHYHRFLITRNDNPNANWDGSYFDFDIWSNARWKLAYIPQTDHIIENNDLKFPVQGGKEIRRIDEGGLAGFNNNGWGDPNFVGRYDGDLRTKTQPVREPNAENYNTRGSTAGRLVVVDTAMTARYYPSIVDFVQCSTSSFEDTGIVDATTSNITGPWANDQVVRHFDQEGNVFYSSYFGAAGRWMVSNLAAITYTPTALSTMTDQDAMTPFETGQDFDDQKNYAKYYAYADPDKGDDGNTATGTPAYWGTKPPKRPSDTHATSWRPEEGVLYNWYAATGRKDVVDVGGEGNQDHALVQGICPDGWHLPSDKELSKLEEVIYNNISQYSVYDTDDIAIWNANKTGWQSAWETNVNNDDRGDELENRHLSHGKAMIEVCPPVGAETAYVIGSSNYSKEIKDGGFHITLVGRIAADSKVPSAPKRLIFKERGWNVNLWSSSIGPSYGHTAWSRGWGLWGSKVSREYRIRTELHPVRCVKN